MSLQHETKVQKFQHHQATTTEQSPQVYPASSHLEGGEEREGGGKKKGSRQNVHGNNVSLTRDSVMPMTTEVKMKFRVVTRSR